MANIKIGNTVYNNVETIKVQNAEKEGTYIKFKPVVETPITSSVSAFNIDLQLVIKEQVTVQSTLGGGDGDYAASINGTDISTASINTNILTVVSNYPGDSGSITASVDVTSGSQSLSIPLNISYQTCLTGDTMITMYDGSQKRIDEIELGEEVLSLDENGNMCPGYVYYADSHCTKFGKHYDRFVFSDGTELKIVHRHRFFNMNEQKFVHLDNWYEGDSAYKLDGSTVTLIEKHLRDYEGDIPHYTIFCEHNTYFANGILCGNRFSDPVRLDNGISTYSVGGEVYMPIILKLPETFSNYTDAWLDSKTLDLMLTKDGKTINYYQVGYSDCYGAIYKKTDDNWDLDHIESFWEKICDLSKESGTKNVNGKDFDCVIIYAKRVIRQSPIAVYSSEENYSNSSGGGISIQYSNPSITT